MTGPPVRSLWLREAMAGGFEPAPPLEGSAAADVCIVGGGYTGLWTALRLKELEPSLDVTIVEADICGGGASGRNGGFVLSWWAKFETLKKVVGAEEAARLAHASADAVAAIGSFCKEHGIDADYRHDGWIWAAVNRAQVDSWRSVQGALDHAGEHPFVELTPDQVAARTGSPVHVGGVFEPSGATVQPAALAFGLRRVARERGIRIHERSPMTSLESAGAATIVRTPQGSVRAGRVILAMNAWAVRFHEIRRWILVVGSDIVATDPIPDRLTGIGWTDGSCISDSRLLVHYYRTTADGRIAFGKGGGAIALRATLAGPFEGASRRAATVEAAFRFTYPMLADVPITSSWTGPIDRPRTGLPVFGALKKHPRVLYGVGYSGNGVGPSYVGGRILASLALERSDEWSTCGLVDAHVKTFPPQPLRFVGGHVVRRAIEQTERRQDEGRRPGRIASRLIRLAPAGLVPVRR